ncbi:MAG TPA: hypothetical protein PLO57_09160, partial [Candidatus Cloacimonadota bacterium]|nr:hypothetical protein [Candidatus Cloacimonadota bacterium]
TFRWINPICSRNSQLWGSKSARNKPFFRLNIPNPAWYISPRRFFVLWLYHPANSLLTNMPIIGTGIAIYNGCPGMTGSVGRIFWLGLLGRLYLWDL